MPTLIDKLHRLGFEPQQSLQLRKSISVKENGKKYTLELIPPKECAAYQVDGEIVSDGNKCDKLITVDCQEKGWCEVFVELKGKNISHAISQLEESLKKDCFWHQTI